MGRGQYVACVLNLPLAWYGFALNRDAQKLFLPLRIIFAWPLEGFVAIDHAYLCLL